MTAAVDYYATDNPGYDWVAVDRCLAGHARRPTYVDRLEAACILTSRGHNSGEIAAILHCSGSTAKRLRNKAIERLGDQS